MILFRKPCFPHKHAFRTTIIWGRRDYILRETLSIILIYFSLLIWLLVLFKKICIHRHPVRLAYQPPASSIFLSEQTSHQQPASSTFLSEQINTSHQPPAKRTCCVSFVCDLLHHQEYFPVKLDMLHICVNIYKRANKYLQRMNKYVCGTPRT
jgi:hypothetical protein